MRFRCAVLVAVTSLLTVVSPVSAGPLGIVHSVTSDWAFVQRMLYNTPMAGFVAAEARALAPATSDHWFDWTTDGCSAPLVGDTGLSFNFRSSCRRHDFGYRNLQLLERRYGRGRTFWNATNRRRVDQQFLADMKAHCRTRSIFLMPRCFAWAETFYAAVRLAGGP
jgi:hypothetical protein